MKNKLFLFIASIVILSCNNINSTSKLSNLIVDECPNLSSCIINLDDIIEEDWDYVLITNQQISLSQLNSLLGFEYPYFSDIGNRIIFVKNKKVIYHEDEFPEAETTSKNTLRFEIKNNYLKLKKSDSKFSVVKNGDYIELKII